MQVCISGVWGAAFAFLAARGLCFRWVQPSKRPGGHFTQAFLAIQAHSYKIKCCSADKCRLECVTLCHSRTASRLVREFGSLVLPVLKAHSGVCTVLLPSQQRQQENYSRLINQCRLLKEHHRASIGCAQVALLTAPLQPP